VIALADCNNFYVSCERVFRPFLDNKPVIVLSNNDGCAIARSNEAKSLGIGMGSPYHQIRGLCQKNNVRVYSSNYELYGDMSRRVVSALGQFTSQIEVYSIDESFLYLSETKDPLEIAKTMRTKVLQWTGIPISVGLGPTKTLAKLANRLAKKNRSGCLTVSQDDYELIASVEIEDVWGVGRRLGHKLRGVGVSNALNLMRASSKAVRKLGGVVLERTQKELQGWQCLELEQCPQPKKNVCCSRAFGQPITSLNQIEEAVANHSFRGVQKIRKQQSLACGLQAFIKTNPFRVNTPQYSNAGYIGFDEPTDEPMQIISTAKNIIQSIYRKGYQYHKAGIMLLNLQPKALQQGLLFPPKQQSKRKQLLEAIEEIRSAYGPESAFLAAQGIQRKWEMKRNYRSPRYTTNWQEIPSTSTKA
jgi:DNA polymerase V